GRRCCMSLQPAVIVATPHIVSSPSASPAQMQDAVAAAEPRPQAPQQVHDLAAEQAAVTAPPPEKPPVPLPAPVPTQEVPGIGIRFDFNNGCRAVLPKGEHPWRVRLSDLDTGNILFETVFEQGTINSSKRYFVRFKLEIFQQDKPVFNHE